MCAGGKLGKQNPRGNQSEVLHPPFLCQSHRGLRCVLHELIPPKLDCLCYSNQTFVNDHFRNDCLIIGKHNCNIVEEHCKKEITRGDLKDHEMQMKFKFFRKYQIKSHFPQKKVRESEVLNSASLPD